ncbi:MAG: hypothetical protein OJF60_002117 [Burkholderiaceae bacterium]|nr:MAG: hypothetical protein OJF60_002117 [Burkholderiaceae bacterium]
MPEAPTGALLAMHDRRRGPNIPGAAGPQRDRARDD